MSLPETYKALISSEVRGGKPQIKELPLPKPGKDQVLTKIEYAPLNPTDLHTLNNALGSYEQCSVAGREGSGVVVAVGEDLKYPFKVGDRVHVHGNGALAQYYLTESYNVSPIEGNMSFEDAATHIINPGTVYGMGVTAQKGGHKAVIHTAGASALGRMLIRYFKHLGIKLINVVRKDEYIEELKKEGADYVLNMKSPNFEKELKEIAEKEKATMALEAVAGDFTNVILRALPPGSTCYVYGSLSFENIKNIDIAPLFAKKSLTGFVYFDCYLERLQKGEIQQYYKEIHDLLPTVFKSHVQKVFKLEEIEEAIAYYHENSSKGKILIKPN